MYRIGFATRISSYKTFRGNKIGASLKKSEVEKT